MRLRREQWFRVLLLLLIFGLAGPEIAPALELSMLLELLGVALFVVAYGSAMKMLAIDLVRGLAEILLPPLPVTVLRHSAARPCQRGVALFYLLGSGMLWLCHFMLWGVLVAWLVR